MLCEGLVNLTIGLDNEDICAEELIKGLLHTSID